MTQTLYVGHRFASLSRLILNPSICRSDTRYSLGCLVVSILYLETTEVSSLAYSNTSVVSRVHQRWWTRNVCCFCLWKLWFGILYCWIIDKESIILWRISLNELCMNISSLIMIGMPVYLCILWFDILYCWIIDKKSIILWRVL